MAGYGKDVIAEGRLAIRPVMASTFATAVLGTYPRDNHQAVKVLGDFVEFLRSESSVPFYLHSNNTFQASTDVDMNFFLGIPAIYAIGGLPGFDVAQNTATVNIQDQSTVTAGGSTVTARCVSYSVWAPITISSLLGAQQAPVQTSSDVSGPVEIPIGGQVQFQVPYVGHSKDFLNLFEPHYLVVESSIGPWKTGSAYEPFLVLAPGEIFSPLSWVVPLVLTSRDVLAPASGKRGRLRTSDLKYGPKDLTRLMVGTLSAATPVLTTSFTAGTNLWALDLRLFAPAEAGVSLLVTDSKGQRLGFSSTNGMTYSELIGFVTEQWQHPISLRLLNPPAGETYTATVGLLTPGSQPVPMSLFSEAESVSGAIMVSLPSRVILDGDRGAVRSVDVNIGEASQQQALTNVSGTLSNLVQWGGTAVLPLLTNTTQSVPDIGAGESGSVSWPVQVSDAAERGKYVGTVRLSSAQTAELDVPVVAVVRRATNIVSLFEGTNWVSGILQTTVTNSSGGYGQTWVHVPKGYYVVHAQMGVAANSTNLLNPTIDVGADGSAEWAFSGLFDLGVVVDNLETAFNNYLVAHSAGSNTVAVPIRLTGNAGESMQFGGLQVFLETVPNELRAIQVMPDGKASFELLAQPGYQYTIQASTNLLLWESLSSVLATNSVMPFTDISAPGLSTRFYRAVLE